MGKKLLKITTRLFRIKNALPEEEVNDKAQQRKYLWIKSINSTQSQLMIKVVLHLLSCDASYHMHFKSWNYNTIKKIQSMVLKKENLMCTCPSVFRYTLFITSANTSPVLKLHLVHFTNYPLSHNWKCHHTIQIVLIVKRKKKVFTNLLTSINS